MRYIDLSKIDPKDPKVAAWKKKADSHLAALSSLTTHDERSSYMSKHPFWGDFKPILKSIYGELCWYSEYNLEGGSYGHVDHFRPKNRSKELNQTIILSDGYWWLAYNYQNYRLSCEVCNTKKNDYFPINSIPASNPNDNDDPVLLDPCNREDWQLIDCDNDGKIIALTSDNEKKKRVEISNIVYGLDCFSKGRMKIINSCTIKLDRFISHYNSGNTESFKNDFEDIMEIVSPDTPYSSFALKYIYRKISGKPYETIIKKLLKSYT